MSATRIDLEGLDWVLDYDQSNPDRPVHSETAVVGGALDTGRVDFFTKWQPNSYCSFHGHLADTVSVVIEGEMHVEELDGSRTIRQPGHYSCTPAGRRHWEQAGPDGCVIFYSVQSTDGNAFEVPERDGTPAIYVTVADMLSGQLPTGQEG